MSCDSGVSSVADTTSKGRCLKLFKKKRVMDNLQEVTVGAAGRPGPRQPGSLCHEGTAMETPRFPLRYSWLTLQCESSLALRYATKAQATKEQAAQSNFIKVRTFVKKEQNQHSEKTACRVERMLGNWHHLPLDCVNWNTKET